MPFKLPLSLPFLLSLPSFSLKLMQFLDSSTLLQLLSLNTSIHSFLTSLTPILSKLYYLTFLSPDPLFSLPISPTPTYSTHQSLKLESLLSNNFIQNPIGSISIMKQIKKQLSCNLNHIVGEEIGDSIVRDIFETMKNPDVPLPTLRKQTVGDYCNTSLQILMAEVNWKKKGGCMEMEEEGYREIRRYFVGNHERVLKQLFDNRDILIPLRFQSQLINHYTTTTSPFLNIIVLLLTLIDYHLTTIFHYLSSHTQLPSFQFFLQYLRRYNTYRNMVVQFEDKLGFMMEMFTKGFNQLAKELEIYPGCSVWRTLMKKWMGRMGEFEARVGEGFMGLLMRLREENLQKYVEGQCKLKDLSQQIVSNYIMKNNQCSQNIPINSIQYDIIKEQEPESLQMIVSMFMEYAVDVSSNEYNIHWCESSAHRLNRIYSDIHDKILTSTKQLYNNWNNIFSGENIIQEILENDIDYLRQFIKPTTLTHIIQQANIIISQTLKFNVKQVKGGFEKLDDRIRYLNEKRLIPLELQEEYKEFFDFDKTIRLERIESRIKSIGKKEYGEGQGSKMEVEQEEQKGNVMEVEESVSLFVGQQQEI